MRSHIMSICLLMGFTSLQSCKTATNREPSASLMAAASSNKIVLNKIYRGHGNLTFTSATKFKWKAISGIGMRTAEGTYSVEDGKVTLVWATGGDSSYEIMNQGKTLKELGGAGGVDYVLVEDNEGDQPVAPGNDLTTSDLIEAEKAAAVRIFDRVHVPTKTVQGVCSASEATIQSQARSFNPAKWTVSVDGDSKNLTHDEISAMLAMFDRLHVASVHQDGITQVSQATLKSMVCELSPAHWTATFTRAAN